MLFITIVTDWQGATQKARVKSSSGTQFLLNHNRVSELLVRGTGSMFRYTEKKNNRREVPSWILSTDSVATIATNSDQNPDSVFVALPIFPNEDTSVATVEKLINVDNIIFGEAYAIDTTSSWVTYDDGLKKTTILVDLTLEEIIELSSSWTPQRLGSKVLGWFREIDEVGGQQPNKVAEASDYLTIVSGSGLNKVYTLPDTTPYKNADTDNCWWKTDASLSTTDGNRLIAYDFARTIVKYDNTAPYTLREIIILSSGVTLTTAEMNSLRDYAQLSIWWSNVSSDYGREKGNRIGEQSVWVKEDVFVLKDTFTDTNATGLAAHTMDKGTGWTVVNGTWSINSNMVAKTSDDIGNCYVYTEAGKASYDFSIDIKIPVGQFATGMVFRYQDSTHRWYCLLQKDSSGGSPYVSLFLDAASKGSVDKVCNAGTTYNLRVVVSGNNIKVYFNGETTAIIDVTDATYNTLTKVGLITYGHGLYIKCDIDNLILI